MMIDTFLYYKKQLTAEIVYLYINLGYLFSSKKKAIYIGCIGQGNLGDEGVYQAIKNILKSKIYLYPINYSKPSSGKYIRKLVIKPPDFIVLGGGTIIKKQKNESYLKLLMDFHKLYPNAKLMVYGAGVADTNLAEKIGFPTDIVNWTTFLDKCSFIGVRGIISKRTLKVDWKVKANVEIVHDPAIFYARPRVEVKLKKKKIGINFCNILDRIYGLNQSNVEIFARTFVERLLHEDWVVCLYPTAKSDLSYMKNILGEEITSKTIMYENYSNLETSISFLETLDVFVGQRLHSVIFAAISYTPFYAIEYESKTSDFLESFGLNDFSMRTDQLDISKAYERVVNLYNESEEIQSLLFEQCNKITKEQAVVTQNFLNEL